MIFGRNILKPNVVNWFSCTATYITPEATKHLLLCVLRYTTLNSYMLNFQGASYRCEICAYLQIL